MTDEEIVVAFKESARIKRELVALCKKFVEDNRISCEECISQSDIVIENAYEFIADICNIVGYWEEV